MRILNLHLPLSSVEVDEGGHGDYHTLEEPWHSDSTGPTCREDIYRHWTLVEELVSYTHIIHMFHVQEFISIYLR